MRKIILVIIISVLIIIWVSACRPNGETPAEMDVSGEGYENDFTLLSLEQKEVSLSDYEGKLVILNFWATWCPPCREEIPDFIEVYSQYMDRGVKFLGVSNEPRDTLASFAEEYGINYPILMDGSLDTIMPDWGIRVIPTTFILGKNGQILERHEGILTEEQLINKIENWL